jgi:hypothetical protein
MRLAAVALLCWCLGLLHLLLRAALRPATPRGAQRSWPGILQWLQALLALCGHFFGPHIALNWRVRIAGQLRAADLGRWFGTVDWLSLQLLSALLSGAGMAAFAASTGSMPLVLAAVALAVGWYLPNVWLWRRQRQRCRHLLRSLEYSREQVQVALIGGRPLPAALQMAALWAMPGPMEALLRELGREFAQATGATGIAGHWQYRAVPAALLAWILELEGFNTRS